jgi:murein lipoprotein
MVNKKIIKSTLIVGFALGLSACASNEGLENKITTLTNQVNALTSDVAELKSQQQATNEDVKSVKMAVKQVAEDVQKANERIDNIVASYKK